MDLNVGFIGIGLMGAPMARRLAAARRRLSDGGGGVGGATGSVYAWNRDPEKAAQLVADGVSHEPDLAALVSRSEVLVIMVSDTAAVTDVVSRLIPSLRAGQLIVDCSSIDPAETRTLAHACADRGVDWVDAPVSGGVVGAENGTLAIMAGGDEAPIARARALMAPLCQRFTHVGPVGSGQVAKVCNQMIVACNAVVLAEVVALAEAAGMNAALLPEALMGGFADSLPFQRLVPRMASRTFEPVQWRVRTLLKDLELARGLAAEVGASTPMSSAAAALFREHVEHGHAAEDPSTLVLLHAHASNKNTRAREA